MMKMSKEKGPALNGGKAQIYLKALLEGKNHKRASAEAGYTHPKTGLMHDKFPLFLGWKREWKKKDEEED